MKQEAQADFAILIVGTGLLVGGIIRLNSAASLFADLAGRIDLIGWGLVALGAILSTAVLSNILGRRE